MTTVLNAWNQASAPSATEALLSCCASTRWANEVTARRPFPSQEALLATADQVWLDMREADWLEAFHAHPRIGERKAASATPQSIAWSEQEQSSAGSANQNASSEMTELNAHYQTKFGFTYIICATGKSLEEMLVILKRRVHSDQAAELREAAEQQRQIMQIRLNKWLQG